MKVTASAAEVRQAAQILDRIEAWDPVQRTCFRGEVTIVPDTNFTKLVLPLKFCEKGSGAYAAAENEVREIVKRRIVALAAEVIATYQKHLPIQVDG